MRIEQIGAMGYGGQIAKAQRREQGESEGKRGKARFARQDTYEPSTKNGKASSMKEVQKRVKSNFYSSEVVEEDLSDIFTKLFNR